MYELASGVDTLVLTGRSALPDQWLAELAQTKAAAEEADEAVPLSVGDLEVLVEPHGFGKYRYCLTHPYGRIGVSPNTRLPQFRFQPLGEFLHGAGPTAAVAWFRELVAPVCGPVQLVVSRIDLHADFQEWEFVAEDRKRVVCRAKAVATYERDEKFTGITFGKRGSRSLSCRIYNKTIELAKSGGGYVPEMWGPAFNPELSVFRVEFEFGRSVLKQLRLSSPEQVLEEVGSMWKYATEWLSIREPSTDQTRARWPVHPDWLSVRCASLGSDAHGINRLYKASGNASLLQMIPQIQGHLTSLAAVLGLKSLSDVLLVVPTLDQDYEQRTGLDFPTRVTRKRRARGMGDK